MSRVCRQAQTPVPGHAAVRLAVVILITTHLGADFDALGAAAAATLLEPDARIVFPGSQEVAVRRFVAAESPRLPEMRVRELRRATIERAVVVDSSSLRRLGEVGELLAAAACPVTVFDHHPEGPDSIPGAKAVTEPVAATCTVMARELQRRGLEPDPEVASLLLLGVYEDTGGLTFADTTPADVEAVAWLLDRGARLDWVRRYVLRPLEPEQLDLLNNLVEGAIEHRIGGARIVMSVARPSEHLEEAAYVVHRYAEIFDLPVVVAILEVPPQLVVIARSTHPGLDAGKLLAAHGGGGHATAAACRVRGVSAVELAERLLADIRAELRGEWTAAALANPHLYTCAADTTVATAKQRLVRLRINAMPVQDDSELVGVVTRQTLDNALSHGLGERPVTTVMRPGVEIVSGDTPAEEVEDLFMEGGARLVVVEGTEGAGVITRMDLFRRVYQRQLDAGQRVDRRISGMRTVVHPERSRMQRVLPARLLEVLAAAGETAAELGMRAFLVGGAVRDIMLGRAVEDVDVVVEGHGPDLADRLAQRFGGSFHAHEPFLTAVVRLDDGVRLDVATARTEFYRSPAALPEVESSAMRQDLYRRDFTINAMALDLAPRAFGRLIDFFGGQRDLKLRQIRVLHSLSFLDDPTRVIRAVRFATRLGFEVAPETRQLIAVAVDEGVFSDLTGERLREELVLLFEEGGAAEGLRTLERLGALSAIFPRLRWGEGVMRLLRDTESIFAWSRLERVHDGPRWVVALTALATRMDEEGGALLAKRLALGGEVASTVAGGRRGCERLLAVASRERVRPSQLVQALERARSEWRLIAMAQADDRVRPIMHDALTEWLPRPLPVAGRDLVAAGIATGPALGEALRRTRAAVLDGEVGVDEALEHAVAVARELTGGKP